ncbi:MAG: hypothetical protein WAV08_11080 [Desulfobacterales bacterium]|jgi:hypothetical protein|nr:hypothetical protein [Desulfobacterales bacterium]
MDRITLEKLKHTFLTDYSDWCVSLFMPTHRAGRETEQGPIRFRNLLREAHEQLLAKGLRAAKVGEILKKPQRLLQDKGFWQRQSDGLAVFFSSDAFHHFRLPLAFEELVVISKRFLVKPLLPILTSDGLFHVLALSQNQVRLLEGTRHTVDEVALEGLLQSLAEAFPEAPAEKQLLFHSGTPTGAGKRAAVFYGREISNVNKDRLLRWFRMIDKNLHSLLSDSRSPLVLAGVDYLFPLYREVNTYPHLMDEGIPGNPEGLRPEELHGPAWALVEPIFRQSREAAAAHFRQLAGTGQTTTDVREALTAAHHGRVDVLFLPVGVQVWGHFIPENDRVDVHESPEPGDENLLDLAAIQSLIKGGTVYAVAPHEVPEQAPLAAIFRY